MAKRIHSSLVLFLCASGPSIACDATSDGSIGERHELELVAWPPMEGVDREREAIDELTLRPRASASATSPSERLVKRWMQWAMALPWSTGPIADATGASCGSGQEGPVWFLAGTSGGPATRECTIPAGKQLFFPLINRWCAYPVEFFPTEESMEEAQPEILGWYQDELEHTCALTLRLDGVELVPGGFDAMVEDLYVEIDEPFEVVLNPADHFLTGFGVAGGPMPATGAGHYARIQPLPPGDHVLELGGSTCYGEGEGFETLVTYHLHIGA